MKMYVKREKYLSEIRPFFESDLIKIITGVRRSGKSVIMEQILDEVKVKSKNIIYLDFDNRAVNTFINTWKDIVDYVGSKRQKELCYVFLDEVLEISDWQLACRSLRRENCSVFITGSNSKLLSKEFTKELSGRYVSFRVRPFVYKELIEYAGKINREISVSDYLIWGGFPNRLEFEDVDSQRKYLDDLDKTIVINDIINRYKIRKSEDFIKVTNYILISNARNYSAKSIADYMNSHGAKCSINTVRQWIEYLKEAYVIDEVHKYSRKAKKELEDSRKLYNCDVALNSIRCFDNRYDLTHNLENVIYNELMYRGYTVYVYDNNGREIDFLAIKENKKYYIQVAYSIVESSTYEREFSAFKNISQIDKKIIITNDEVDYTTSNVQHIKLKDFLQMEDII